MDPYYKRRRMIRYAKDDILDYIVDTAQSVRYETGKYGVIPLLLDEFNCVSPWVTRDMISNRMRARAKKGVKYIPHHLVPTLVFERANYDTCWPALLSSYKLPDFGEPPPLEILKEKLECFMINTVADFEREVLDIFEEACEENSKDSKIGKLVNEAREKFGKGMYLLKKEVVLQKLQKDAHQIPRCEAAIIIKSVQPCEKYSTDDMNLVLTMLMTPDENTTLPSNRKDKNRLYHEWTGRQGVLLNAAKYMGCGDAMELQWGIENGYWLALGCGEEVGQLD